MSTMLAYVDGPDVTGINGGVALPDFARNLMYFISPGTGATCGIAQYEGYPSGDVLRSKTRPQLHVSELDATGYALTSAGYIVYSLYTSNSTTLQELYGLTLAELTLFGIPSSSLSPSSNIPPSILTPGVMCGYGTPSQNFMLSCAMANGGEVVSLEIPGLGLTNLGNVTEEHALCGPATGNNAWVLGVSSSDTTFGFYQATPTDLAKITEVVSTSINAALTTYDNVCGIALDQTDGMPIIGIGKTSASLFYFAKLSGAGTVLWAVQVNNLPAFGNVDMPRWSIKNQRLFYLGASNLLYSIDTATGAVTTETIGTLTIEGHQYSEDTGNSLLLQASWVETSTHPVYTGTYMGDEGNHTLSSNWTRFFPGSAFAPPVPFVPGNTLSVNKAWTYVQDGHTFYVLDCGTQGTWAFDTVTNQWNELQTDGTNFAVTNGIMWGQRVVGGDPASNDVWELDPAAMKDSGGLYDIQHIVTGGLSTRSRTFIACDSLRVSASFGEIDDTAGVTFNLRFSDDQEQSWSPYFTIQLSEGAYDTEIAWRSLGSFMAPGRIFELSDSGGLIRIDGCDAMLNGFDNDTQSQDGTRQQP